MRKNRLATACRLCHTALVLPDDPSLDEHARHYATVARAIAYLRAHAVRQPGLEELAAAVHLSPAHLQRVFARWAGISPKRFLQVLTKDSALQRLRASASVLQAACDVGLGSTSRLHELIVSSEAMTPGELKSGGRGLDIGWGFGPTPFGTAFVAWTPRGVCQLDFVDDAAAAPTSTLGTRWPQAAFARDDAQAVALLARVFPVAPTRGTVHLVLRGTNFQIQVWQAMLRTRPGQVLSYTDVAQAVGAPRAQRAVGGALGANIIAWLIPCHRVIRDSGEISNYRWGPQRKAAMLGWEAARS